LATASERASALGVAVQDDVSDLGERGPRSSLDRTVCGQQRLNRPQ
jgi:hypothetical protein